MIEETDEVERAFYQGICNPWIKEEIKREIRKYF